MSITWKKHDVIAFEPVRLRVRSLPLATGVTVQYVAQGAPLAPGDAPLVFVHGLSDSWRSYEPILSLMPGQQAFSFTQRGHGESTQPRYGYTAADFAKDLAAFLDAMRIPRAVLVGHSMGSTAVQRFAVDHPERVAGVVIFGANASWKDNEVWESVVSQFTDPITAEFVRDFQSSDRVPAERLEVMIAESLLVSARTWQEGGRALLTADFTEELSRITAPTLVIWGMEDPLCSEEEQARLCDLIPQAELMAYPDAGHNLHWEHPERFAVDLSDFLARIS